MWRFALALALLLILVACSGGDDERASVDECVFDAPTPSQTSIAAPLPFMAIEDAQRRIDYAIKAPSELPNGVELRAVAIEEVELCPGGSPVWLAYEGAGYSITLRQTPYEPTIGIPETSPVTIGGIDGEAYAAGSVLLIVWVQDGVGIQATATLNDTLTEARFIEILESLE